MKWRKRTYTKWFFALLPYRCCECGDRFWLEYGVKERDTDIWDAVYVYRYCDECAPKIKPTKRGINQ